MLEDFTYETFAPRLHQTFRLESPAGVQDLILIELTNLSSRSSPPPAASRPRRTPFSMVFRGPYNPILPQSTYRFGHDELGTFEIFIVPIGRDQAGTRYEAIFT